MRDLDWNSFDVLVVDDEEDNLDAFRFAFRKSFTLHYALGGAPALEMLDRLDPAVIVTDQRMPGMSGIEFLKQAKERRPDAIGVLLTAYADMAVLIDAVNSGAVDRYIQKPWNSRELTVVLRQAISSFATVRENRRLREQLAHYAGYLEREQRDPIDFGEIASESDAMRQVTARVGEVAPTASHVLIEAEQGAEKEVVARAIHVGSPREERPFVKVTCAAFRGDTLERELFGWRRGAFDGAFGDRAGRFELAHRGTIYLDEPAPLTPALQARLLRLLTDGELEPLGTTESVRVDVRIVVSLTPGIEEAWVREGVLPELVSRLSVFPIRLPPLRGRREDIRALAEHFLRKYARRNARAATSLSDEAIAKLAAYPWPGNARELENVIERAAILSRGDVILPEHLAFDLWEAGSPFGAVRPRPQPDLGRGSAFAGAPAGWRGPAAPPPSNQARTAGAPLAPKTPEPGARSRHSAQDQRQPSAQDQEPGAPAKALADGQAGSKVDLQRELEDIERRELLAALERYGGNKAEVARQFGMQRTTLYYRLKRLGIDT